MIAFSSLFDSDRPELLLTFWRSPAEPPAESAVIKLCRFIFRVSETEFLKFLQTREFDFDIAPAAVIFDWIEPKIMAQFIEELFRRSQILSPKKNYLKERF